MCVSVDIFVCICEYYLCLSVDIICVYQWIYFNESVIKHHIYSGINNYLILIFELQNKSIYLS